MIYNSLLIYLTFRYFRSNENLPLLSKYDKQLKKTIWFPAAMVSLWIIPSLYRILQMGGAEYFGFCLIHAICESINGFVNTLVYAVSKKFRDEFRDSFAVTKGNILRDV